MIEGKHEVDLAPFEDESRGPYWFWELRSLASLPENLKGKAMNARKKHRQVHAIHKTGATEVLCCEQMQDRLLALLAAIRLSNVDQQNEGNKRTSEMPKRIQKAIEKLERTPDLQSINERFSEDLEEECNHQVLPFASLRHLIHPYFGGAGGEENEEGSGSRDCIITEERNEASGETGSCCWIRISQKTEECTGEVQGPADSILVECTKESL